MGRFRSLRRHIWDDDGVEYVCEPELARRRRLHEEKTRDGRKAREVERSGNVVNLERAAKRLKHARAEDRILYVQQWHMEKAVEAMRCAGVTGAVSNITGTQRKRVNGRRNDWED